MKFKFLKASVLCALLPVLAAAQTSNITITGKINPLHNGEKVTLIYGSMAKMVMDTTRVTNGSIVFHVANSAPQIANMLLNGKNKGADVISIFLAKGDISFTTPDSLKHAIVTGDKLSEDYGRMNAPIVRLQQQYYYYAAKLAAIPADKKQTEEALAIKAQMQDIKLRVRAVTYAAIDANPNSYIALYMLKSVDAVVYDVTMPHFSKLSNELRNSAEGKALEGKIMLVKNLQKGLTAKDFESTTPEGKKLSLHEITSTAKYTLIDFWASWCAPCRMENPNVVKAYTAYHAKGLNILSVSLDTKAENWKTAIAKDGMPWYHVSSLMGFKEPAAILYGIDSIPQNVLVDAHGVIVASNLRGEDLMEKLKELL